MRPTLASALLASSFQLSILVAVAACGGEARSGTDAAATIDATPGIDAFFGPHAIVPRLIADFDDAALLVTSPPNDARTFVVLREGIIRIIEDETTVATPFVDLSDEHGGPVLAGGEQGLLGLAFHPDFATNGTFYVYYTTSTKNVIDAMTVSAANPDVADVASRINIITITDPFSNHNGGMIEFGPDGFLYAGTGDGGSGGDPMGNGQNPSALLGKFLRLDVDHPSGGKNYGIPASNPFATTGGAPEVFMVGLRNPYRWSFDTNGDLYIGDVGQDRIEELDVIKAGTGAGLNLGWRQYEASACFDPPCTPDGKFFPQFERTHTQGWCSIIGGQVYRGSRFPELTGEYFFTDYCAPRLWRGKAVDGVLVEAPVELGALPAKTVSIHADNSRELFLTTENGGVYVLEDVATP